MAIDFGSDIGGVDDVDAELSFVEGAQCWAQAILCRLGNVEGTTEDDPTNGYDLSMLIGSVVEPGDVERKIVAQAMADERTATARASVTRSGETLVVTTTATSVKGDRLTAVHSVAEARIALIEFNLQEAA
jgi:hypothetical protein